jgi:hypothetical protein
MTTLIRGLNAVVQNTIYALPPRESTIFTDTVGATIQSEADSTFGQPIAITLTEGRAKVGGGGFLRCTSGNINVWVS